MTNNADFEVNVPFAGVHTYDTATAASSTLWGIGDTFVRSKINLWGNDGGDTAAAVIPYVKAPSAPIGIGNGAVEGGLIGPLAVTLPNSFTLVLVPEVDVLKNIADDGRHGNYVFDVNLSREVIKNVTAYVELWSDYNADPVQGATLMSFDTAVAWVFLPNAQIDFGANFGITQRNTSGPSLCGPFPALLIDRWRRKKARCHPVDDASSGVRSQHLYCKRPSR